MFLPKHEYLLYKYNMLSKEEKYYQFWYHIFPFVHTITTKASANNSEFV